MGSCHGVHTIATTTFYTILLYKSELSVMKEYSHLSIVKKREIVFLHFFYEQASG